MPRSPCEYCHGTGIVRLPSRPALGGAMRAGAILDGAEASLRVTTHDFPCPACVAGGAVAFEDIDVSVQADSRTYREDAAYREHIDANVRHDFGRRVAERMTHRLQIDLDDNMTYRTISARLRGFVTVAPARRQAQGPRESTTDRLADRRAALSEPTQPEMQIRRLQAENAKLLRMLDRQAGYMTSPPPIPVASQAMAEGVVRAAKAKLDAVYHAGWGVTKEDAHRMLDASLLEICQRTPGASPPPSFTVETTANGGLGDTLSAADIARARAAAIAAAAAPGFNIDDVRRARDMMMEASRGVPAQMLGVRGDVPTPPVGVPAGHQRPATATEVATAIRARERALVEAEREHAVRVEGNRRMQQVNEMAERRWGERHDNHMADAMLYGTGIMRDGVRVPPSEMYRQEPVPPATAPPPAPRTGEDLARMSDSEFRDLIISRASSPHEAERMMEARMQALRQPARPRSLRRGSRPRID